MRQEWSDELRRAYDQGYWDARREMDHMMRSRGSQGSSGDAASMRGRGEQERSQQRSQQRGSERGWLPEGAEGYATREDRGSERREESLRYRGLDNSTEYRSERERDLPSGRQPGRYDEGYRGIGRSAGLQRFGDESYGSNLERGRHDDRLSGSEGYRRIDEGDGRERERREESGSYRRLEDRERRGDDRDYPPGDRRSVFERRDRDHDRHERRDRDDEGFFERAGDKLRSWFGDEDDDQNRRRARNDDGRMW